MPNLKISQLEKVTNMDPDSFVLVVQNGKNYRMSIKEAIAANVDIKDVDLSNYYTKEETANIINDSIEDYEIVSEGGNTTTITEVVNNVESQSEKIIQLENTVQNINEAIATKEDAAATFGDIFIY